MDTVFWSARQGAEWKTKVGLAEMLKGGVIMDVTNAAQAKIAEEAGAAAVMALERVPADIRAQGGVARMSDPKMIKEIQDAVSIPVMAKCRIGHFVEARILEALGVDFIDESEVLTPRTTDSMFSRMVSRSLRLRLPRFGRSPAQDRRGRGHDSHQGRARNGRRYRSGQAYEKRGGRHSKAKPAARGGTHDRRQGAGRSLRAGLGGGEDWKAPGAELLGGRDRHAGRRGSHDARWRRIVSTARVFSCLAIPSAAPRPLWAP